MRYKAEHKMSYSIYICKQHVLFCLLYKHTDNDFFGDFTKISEHFPKILKKLYVSHTHVCKYSPNIPTISEDFRRLSRKIRRCLDQANKLSTALRVKHDISEIINIFIRPSQFNASFPNARPTHFFSKSKQ